PRRDYCIGTMAKEDASNQNHHADEETSSALAVAAAATAAAATQGYGDDDDAAAAAAAQLMARLGSQFADLDLSQLNCSLREGQLNDKAANLDGSFADSSSEESSLAEPTPEELAAWQAQQFQKGQEILQRQKEETMDPLQKRRLALRQNSTSKKNQATGAASCNNRNEAYNGDDDDWEEIAALPDLQDQSSVFFTEFSRNSEQDDLHGAVVVGISPLLRTLATSQCGDPELLGTAWQRLYSSVEGDGTSFYNLSHAICQYDGPTLLLLSVVPSRSKTVVSPGSDAANTATTATIGFFTTSTWQESSDYHGNYSEHDTSFLFAMDESENQVEFFGMKASNGPGYMYCHPSTTSNKKHRGSSYHGEKKHRGHERTNGAMHGLGIGGTPSQPRLHLTETLEECRGLTYDSSRSFQDGNLFLNKPSFDDSLYFFDVESIEVWGVGGKAWIQDALSARDKARGVRASNLQQRRRIYDKSQLLDDFRNGIHSTTTKSSINTSYFDHIVYPTDRCDV
ncbi:MAG: hypothetical protein SGILL_007932, partial [Bacillariaceae sp.]